MSVISPGAVGVGVGDKRPRQLVKFIKFVKFVANSKNPYRGLAFTAATIIVLQGAQLKFALLIVAQ